MIYSDNIKYSSAFCQHFEKKSSKSDHFWRSYGHFKKLRNGSKSCFSWKGPWNIDISILLKEQILCRRGCYTLIWILKKFNQNWRGVCIQHHFHKLWAVRVKPWNYYTMQGGGRLFGFSQYVFMCRKIDHTFGRAEHAGHSGRGGEGRG